MADASIRFAQLPYAGIIRIRCKGYFSANSGTPSDAMKPNQRRI